MMKKSNFYTQYTPIKKQLIQPQTKEKIDLNCSICNTKTSDLFHFTKLEYLDDIASEGVLKPMYGNRIKSGSVSFTKDTSFLFPNGNVKLVFHNSIPNLKPICYYGDIEQPKLSDKEKELIDAIENQASIENKGLNEIRSDYGIQDSSYKQECEWFTQQKVPLKKNLKKVILYVPWNIDEDRDINCNNTSPKYARNQYQAYNTFKKSVSKTRDFAKKLGVPFRIESNFPYIYNWIDNEYIPMTITNLKRIAKGQEPIITNIKPNVDECNLLMTDNELIQYDIDRREKIAHLKEQTSIEAKEEKQSHILERNASDIEEIFTPLEVRQENEARNYGKEIGIESFDINFQDCEKKKNIDKCMDHALDSFLDNYEHNSDQIKAIAGCEKNNYGTYDCNEEQVYVVDDLFTTYLEGISEGWEEQDQKRINKKNNIFL